MKPKEKVSKYNYIFMMGHICTDIAQGALPAMLPYIVKAYGLTLAAAGGLVFAANFISSIVQPLFGHLGDRIERPWYMAMGIFLSGLGISLVGLFGNYVLMCVAVVIMGTGVALFHPEGSKMANMASGSKKGTGMSIFSVGGNIGFAVGPIIAVPAMEFFGLKGSLVFLVPTIIMAIIMLFLNNNFKEISRKHAVKKEKIVEKQGEKQKDNWKGLTIIAIIMFFRSVANYGMTAFIPLFFTLVLMQSKMIGGLNLTLYSVAAAIATLTGGRLADKYGFKRIIIVCSIVAPILLLFFSFNHVVVLATILLILFAASSSGCHSLLLVTGQNFMPNRIGMASGILFGLTVSIGGMFSPIVGWIGDNYGLNITMLTLSIFSFMALFFVFVIPKQDNYHKLDTAGTEAEVAEPVIDTVDSVIENAEDMQENITEEK